MLKNLIVLLVAASLCSCGGKKSKPGHEQPKATEPLAMVKDKHTLSNADSVEMRHLDLDIQVDMDNRQIRGCAEWAVTNKRKAKTLILDTYDLTIDKVLVDGNEVKFVLDSLIQFFGSALHIPISENTASVMVCYKSGPAARALQWLDPQQTHDKQKPFLYTQSESIYARSWIPCADGPGIRFTYTAHVTVPKGLMALMSAENPQEKNDSGVYNFNMETPIPAYLMALAVGDLSFRQIDDRTGVYSEPGMVDKAAWELSETGRMIDVAEQLYGPYRWSRYDVLVLPPGFPIGGMENPRLTFATPTIISGDRSLVNLIAHELAHSWSGNLVTNATWNDFWLNEGFTVYFERRITERMLGESYTDMLWELGYQDMATSVNDLGAASKDTWLKLDLTGRDPDDGLTDIAYEKGSHFLKLIELNVGKDVFDRFLLQYFTEHAFKTITTEAFLKYMDTALIRGDEELKKKLTISEWVYGPGIPANCPRAEQERFGKVDSQRTRFLNGVAAEQLATVEWTTHEWLHFLRKMPATLSPAQMRKLDDAFNLTNTGNSEIADLWFVLSVRTNYTRAYQAMDQFLSRVGRRKFLEPLYREMMKTAHGSAMAHRIYNKYRKNYHPLAQESLDQIVEKKS